MALEVNIINGKKIADDILNDIAKEIYTYSEKPLLCIIQIGSQEASNTYIRNKIKSCEKIGMGIELHKFESDVVDTNNVLQIIDKLNNNKNVNGIIVQLPLPSHLDSSQILNTISYEKDVDGFHTKNIGELAIDGKTPRFIPCTPLGCIELLKRNKIQIKGNHVVIVGKSNIVGLPLALMLMKENATVTVCHKYTRSLVDHLKLADIVIVACGQPQMIKKDWLKVGVVVIDVGINVIETVTGRCLVGDVDFNEVKHIASAITPVPGGVGPMTVAMLLKNTLNAYKLQNKIK
tara:strand:+ start:6682 stop:7554 length:873 start_codon:yes stop_codon:yes gene_type:complete